MKKHYLTRAGLLFMSLFAFAKTDAQQSYTFTNCGATGSVGPTQLMVTSTYSSTNLNGAVTTITNGIQTWTVPYTGNFRIEARGAQGGGTGGQGAIMAGDFALVAGEVIQILVGQMGDNGGSGPSGGGGGSYVVRSPYNATTAILVIAGGGSGNGNYSFTSGVSTSTGVTGGVAGGVNGNGGGGGTRGAGGGGFLTDGSPCSVNTNYASPGRAFVNGGAGGYPTNNCSFTAAGGFGGGSSHGGNCINNGGAGGGFSGGGGSSNTTAGGGGSLNNGTNQSNTSGANTGHGRVTITELCNIQMMSSSSGTANPALLCSGNSLTLTTTAVSNYSWSNGATTSSIVVAPTTNTVYSIVGTSSLNCSAAASLSITVSNGLPVLTIVNNNTSVCLGASASLTASGAFTYTWTGGIGNGQTFTPSATSGYTVSGANGCGVSTASTSIVVAPLPVSVVSNPSVACEGQSAVITASSSVNGYTWAPGGQTNSMIVVTPTAPTVYSVAVSDGTCYGLAVFTMQTKPSPTVQTTGNFTNVCEGSVVTVTASGADTYTWSPGGQQTASISDTPTTSTLYQVSGTNSVGCTTSANWIAVVKPRPVISASSNTHAVCVNGSALLSSSGGTSYAWTSGPSTQTYAINPAATGVYTVTGTGQNGCTNTATVSVGVFNPYITVTPTNPGVCNGEAIMLTADAEGASTYSWNGAFGSAGMAFSPTATTIYTVTAEASSTLFSILCDVTKTVQVQVFSNPTVTIVTPMTKICRNEIPPILSGAGASSYVWNPNSINSPTLQASNIFSSTYSVTGTDANGCTGTASQQIIVEQCTGINVNAADKLAIFPNPNQGTFRIQAGSSMEVSVMNELGQVVKSIKVNGGETVEVDGLSSGIYFVVGTTVNGSVKEKIIVTR